MVSYGGREGISDAKKYVDFEVLVEMMFAFGFLYVIRRACGIPGMYGY